MDADETSIRPVYALTSSFSSVDRPTLNDDPFNVQAEQLAMDLCKDGFDVVHELTETEMVVTCCGSITPGTPDGGFVDSKGLLRLVQVVRVPLLPDMDAEAVATTLHRTVLAKLVKSQAWMKQTGILPHDFIIFCWLPPVGEFEACAHQSEVSLWTEALMWNVKAGGWPFSLEVRVPDDPASMFPINFGKNYHEGKNLLDSLCYFLKQADFETDQDDEAMQWNLFDQDFDEDTSDTGGDDVSRDVRALVELAIRMIETAVAQQVVVNAVAVFVGFVIENSDTFCWLACATAHMQALRRAEITPRRRCPRELPGIGIPIQGWDSADLQGGLDYKGSTYPYNFLPKSVLGALDAPANRFQHFMSRSKHRHYGLWPTFEGAFLCFWVPSLMPRASALRIAAARDHRQEFM